MCGQVAAGNAGGTDDESYMAFLLCDGELLTDLPLLGCGAGGAARSRELCSLRSPGDRSLFAGRVFIIAQLPCGSQSACKGRFIYSCQPDVGCPVFAPATCHGHKDFGSFADEGRLLFSVQHEIAIAQVLGGERGKDAASDPEVFGTHVRCLGGAWHA